MDILERLGLSFTIRWLTPWAAFALALAAGRLVAGGEAVRIDELTFGLPLAWLASWLGRRGVLGATAAVATAGLLVGILA
jgi:hypothetical protein